MAISQEERWHVEQLIKNLRINHPLTSDSTFDQCLRFLETLDKVNLDVIAEICGTFRLFPENNGELFTLSGAVRGALSNSSNDLTINATGTFVFPSSASDFQLITGAN